MADSTVSLVIDKLGTLLVQEVNLLKGVCKEVADLKDDLEDIRAFLKDADSKMEKGGVSEGVKVWVKQVREVAYRIEDVVDKYMLQVAQHRDRHGFTGFLQRIYSFVQKLQPRHEVALEIQNVSKNVKKAKDRSEKFQFISSRPGASSNDVQSIILPDPRLYSTAIREDELVGIDSPRNELISSLLSEAHQRKVIAVVGLGGVGKTTVARKVYDNHNVKEHFDCHAWITVSQSYDVKEILRSILKKFYEEKNEEFPQNIVVMDGTMLMDDTVLISKLKENLQGKRYLVVFDDVWDSNFWINVEPALLDDNNDSRILITTRNENVANFCRGSSLVHLYRMKLLPHQEAWELFCRKAFKFEGQCPEHLEQLSQEIVRRCGGLPLAIVAVGGLLATKSKMVEVWEKFLDSLASALVDDPHLDYVTKILSLSYGDLSYNLKSCFLFFGMFSEDSSVERRRLIQLWIAGGFVQEKEGMRMEEVAEEYLTEFICRNLVQVGEVSYKGTPKTYHIHDMVREVILFKSEELGFCHLSGTCSTFEGIARHLSISGSGSNNPKSNTRCQTRSIMVFNEQELQESNICGMYAKCKLLTTLDFEGYCGMIDDISKELGKLQNLKYLNLRNTFVSKLPKSIGKLHNLESLDLRGTGVRKLPVVISRFPKLRHLLGDGLEIRGSVEHLKCLQTLYGIIVVDEDERLIKELGMLKQMRKLRICYDLKRENEKDLCISLEKITSLQSLYIGHEHSILKVQSVSSPPLHLQTLKLEGKLERLPEWISKLNNLSKLRLLFSRLIDDPMKVLQALPNLKYLRLYCAYDGEKMHFEERGFQKLKLLEIIGLGKLNTMVIDKEAMPVVEVLCVEYCGGLKRVPSGIQHLTGLKGLRLIKMSYEFNQRLSRDGGEDYWIVKHIPKIEIVPRNVA